MEYAWPGHPNQRWWPAASWPNEEVVKELFFPVMLGHNRPFSLLDEELQENLLIFLNYVIRNTVMSILKDVPNFPIKIGQNGEPTVIEGFRFPIVPPNVSIRSDQVSMTIGTDTQLIPGGHTVELLQEMHGQDDDYVLQLVSQLFEMPTEDAVQEEREKFNSEQEFEEEFVPWFLNAIYLRQYREREFLFLHIMAGVLTHNHKPPMPRWVLDLVHKLMSEDIRDLKESALGTFTVYAMGRGAEARDMYNRCKSDWEAYILQRDKEVDRREVAYPKRSSDCASEDFFQPLTHDCFVDDALSQLLTERTLRGDREDSVVGEDEGDSESESAGDGRDFDLRSGRRMIPSRRDTGDREVLADDDGEPVRDEHGEPVLDAGRERRRREQEDEVRRRERRAEVRRRRVVISSEEEPEEPSEREAAAGPTEPEAGSEESDREAAAGPTEPEAARASAIRDLYKNLNLNKADGRVMWLTSDLDLSDDELETYALKRLGLGYAMSFDFKKSAVMYPWQKKNRDAACVQRGRNQGLLIADGMGLGKTVSAIACILDVFNKIPGPKEEFQEINDKYVESKVLIQRPRHQRVNVLLVVRPAIKSQFLSELERFTGLSDKNVVYEWGDARSHVRKFDERVNTFAVTLHVVSLNLLVERVKNVKKDVDESTQKLSEAHFRQCRTFLDMVWDGIVVDEAHDLRVTDPGAKKQSLLTVEALAKKTLKANGLVLLLTGTPLINGLVNMNAYARICLPKPDETKDTIFDAKFLEKIESAITYKEDRHKVFQVLKGFLINTPRPEGLFPALCVYPAQGNAANPGEVVQLDSGILELDKNDKDMYMWVEHGESRKLSEFEFMKALAKKLEKAEKKKLQAESLGVINKMVLASVDARLIAKYPSYDGMQMTGDNETEGDVIQQDEILKKPSSTLKELVSVAEQLRADTWRSPATKPELGAGEGSGTLSENKYYKESALLLTPVSEGEWVRDHKTGGTQRKVIVFSRFKATLEVAAKLLYNRLLEKVPGLEEPDVYHGGLTATARDRIIRNFKSNPNAWFLCVTTLSGGVGLNLTEASAVIFLDRWWTRASHDQAIARACRPGQTRDVRVVYLCPRNTICRFIESIRHDKQEVLKQKLDKSVVDASVRHLYEIVGDTDDIKATLSETLRQTYGVEETAHTGLLSL